MKAYVKIILILIILVIASRVTAYVSTYYFDKNLPRQDGFIAGASPYHIESGKKAILVIHGFSGSPMTMKELDPLFLSNNLTIHSILLPGHGTSTFDLNNVNRTDWILAAEKSYLDLRKNYSEVYIFGYSLGGDLALQIASKHNVSKVILINAPIKYNLNNLELLFPLLKFIEGYHVKGILPGSEKENEYFYKKYSLYRSIPVKSMEEVVYLTYVIRNNLGKINSPILIFQAEKDTLVDPFSSLYIYSHVSSKEKKIITLKESSHINLTVSDRRIISSETSSFLNN